MTESNKWDGNEIDKLKRKKNPEEYFFWGGDKLKKKKRMKDKEKKTIKYKRRKY